MFEELERIGVRAKDTVLSGAELLKEDFAPGIVSIALVACLTLLILLLVTASYRQRAGITWLKKQISTAAGEEDFGAKLHELDMSMEDARTKFQGPRARVAEAWLEYRETTTVQTTGHGETIVRNSVRPGYFFNADDLGFGPGFLRIVPGLFVTIGLFLTFLGLISALDTAGKDLQGDAQGALNTLLTVASAKFIMSLTGLLCSIVFTIFLRLSAGSLERKISALCRDLEKRMTFISLEEVAVDQLAAIREQREHFKAIGTELVAELSRPLREELPQAMSRSIATAIEPLVQNVAKVGAEGMGDMVKDLSSRFSTDVERALGEASTKLADAADKIGMVADRLDASSGHMGAQMNGAIEQMSIAMGDLQSSISDQAVAAGAAVGDAGSAVVKQMQASIEAIGEASDVAVAEAGERLLAPLRSMTEELHQISQSIAAGTGAMRSLSTSVSTGSEAVDEAAASFRGAATELVNVSGPMRSTADALAATSSQLATATTKAAEAVAETNLATARSARETLEAAQAVLGRNREAIERALEGVRNLVEGLRGQGDRLDDIDEKLGAAFEAYNNSVSRSLEQITNHVREVQSELAPSLDTLREVVDQAERFVPQQGKR